MDSLMLKQLVLKRERSKDKSNRAFFFGIVALNNIYPILVTFPSFAFCLLFNP